MNGIYPNQFFYPYTIYSPQQCICQSPQSAINEQVAQMNMNTRLQMMQIEQAMRFQTDMINQSINSILPYHNPTACPSAYHPIIARDGMTLWRKSEDAKIACGAESLPKRIMQRLAGMF